MSKDNQSSAELSASPIDESKLNSVVGGFGLAGAVSVDPALLAGSKATAGGGVGQGNIPADRQAGPRKKGKTK